MRKTRKIIVPYSKLKLYLFGSILYDPKPNDIDLLIQYNNSTSSNDMLKFRNALKSYYNLNLHITLLKDDELKETKFLSKIKYFEIKL